MSNVKILSPSDSALPQLVCTHLLLGSIDLCVVVFELWQRRLALDLTSKTYESGRFVSRQSGTTSM